jgi:hypothetical protein
MRANKKLPKWGNPFRFFIFLKLISRLLYFRLLKSKINFKIVVSRQRHFNILKKFFSHNTPPLPSIIKSIVRIPKANAQSMLAAPIYLQRAADRRRGRSLILSDGSQFFPCISRPPNLSHASQMYDTPGLVVTFSWHPSEHLSE